VPLTVQNRVLGVLEMVNKADGGAFGQEDLPVLQAIADLIAPVIENIRQSQNDLIVQNTAVSLLLSVVQAADAALGRHAKSVASYTLLGANGLAIPREKRYMLQCAAVLHDIGKLGIRSSGAGLTDEQRQALRRHPVTGYNLLRGIKPMQEAVLTMLHHHERYDGNGYPKRLKDDSIPLWSRLIAVADAFDHMTTPQANREALGKKEALVELRRYSGSKFDPAVAKAFAGEYIKSVNRRAPGA
jgi:HD-GYP domain-containing protein (c-di-GMP phosphodiesterase class II)